MAFQIRITPGAVRAAAQEYHRLSEVTEETTVRLSALSAELADGWEGGSSRQVLDAFQELRTISKHISHALEGSTFKLQHTADAFEALDGNASPMMAARSWDAVSLMRRPLPLRDLMLGVSDMLRIVPDQVRSVAAKMEDISGLFRQSCEEIRRRTVELSNDWEGNAFNRFALEMDEISDAFLQLSDGSEELARVINEVAARYEALDDSLRDLFR